MSSQSPGIMLHGTLVALARELGVMSNDVRKKKRACALDTGPLTWWGLGEEVGQHVEQ